MKEINREIKRERKKDSEGGNSREGWSEVTEWCRMIMGKSSANQGE